MKNISMYAITMIFLMVYHVPIFPINILYIITPIAYLHILFNMRNLKPCMQFIKTTYIWLILLILYQSGVSFNNGYSVIETSVGMIWWGISIIPISISIVCSCNKKENRNIAFLHSFIIAVVLQCICVLVAVSSPSIKSFFLRFVDTGNMIANGQYYFRLFGWARYLTGFTAMSLGLTSGIFFYLGFKYNKFYYFFSVLSALAGVINARTSAVILAACVGWCFLFCKKNVKNKMKWILSVFILLFILINSVNFKVLSDNDTAKWITEGFNEISNFIEGRDTGYFQYATNTEKWKLPKEENFIFGEGTTAFHYKPKVGFTTDIGYVNDLWIGGFLFSFLFYCFFFFHIRKLYNIEKSKNNPDALVIPGMLAIALLIGNFKGIVDTDNDLISVFFLILCNQVYFKPQIVYNNYEAK